MIWRWMEVSTVVHTYIGTPQSDWSVVYLIYSAVVLSLVLLYWSHLLLSALLGELSLLPIAGIVALPTTTLYLYIPYT